MTGYLFIYTRLDNFDYRLLYAPNESILPNPTRRLFIDFAREVINTDNTGNGQILEPRWSVIKCGNLALFGIGCINKSLGEVEQLNDKRTIRGFFGIVVESPSELVISHFCDLSFYKHIFEQYVKPIWCLQKKDEAKTNSIVIAFDLDERNVQKGRNIIMNNNIHQCQVHASSNSVQDFFISCLSYDEVDFVSNLNTSEHVVFHSLYAFHNITLIGNNCESFFRLSNVNKRVNDNSFSRRKEGKHDVSSTNSDTYSMDSIVDKVIDKLKYCRHSVIDFLRAFAARYNYDIIPRGYCARKPEDYSKRCPKGNHEVLESQVQIAEDRTMVEKDILDYTQKRDERRSSLASLRDLYHSEPVESTGITTIEEISDSEIVEPVQQSTDNNETFNTGSNLDELH